MTPNLLSFSIMFSICKKLIKLSSIRIGCAWLDTLSESIYLRGGCILIQKQHLRLLDLHIQHNANSKIHTWTTCGWEIKFKSFKNAATSTVQIPVAYFVIKLQFIKILWTNICSICYIFFHMLYRSYMLSDRRSLHKNHKPFSSRMRKTEDFKNKK